SLPSCSMWAAEYQMSEPASCRMCGPGAASIKSSGFACARTAKIKSEPRPTQAVPSLRSLDSKVELMASRKFGLAAFASSTSCVAVDFSAAIERGCPKQDRNVMPTTESQVRCRAEGCIGPLRGGALILSMPKRAVKLRVLLTAEI